MTRSAAPPAWLIGLALLAGCGSLLGQSLDDTGSASGDSSPPDSDSDTPAECDAEVSLIEPPDGHLAVALDAAVEAVLSKSAPGAVITLEGPSGPVPGSSSTSGTSVVFHADSVLDRNAQYTATATACERSDRSTFRTVCEPISAGDVLYRVYDLDLSEALWLAPEGFNSLVVTLEALGYAENLNLLLQIDGLSGNSLDILIALGETIDGVLQQDDNDGTYRVVGDLSDNPSWDFGPLDLRVESSGGPLWLRDFELETAFSCDGDALLSVEVLSTWDLRDVWVENEPLCDTVQLYFPDIVCQDCGDGVETCLYTSLIAEEVSAIEGIVLVER